MNLEIGICVCLRSVSGWGEGLLIEEDLKGVCSWSSSVVDTDDPDAEALWSECEVVEPETDGDVFGVFRSRSREPCLRTVRFEKDISSGEACNCASCAFCLLVIEKLRRGCGCCWACAVMVVVVPVFTSACALA